MYANPAKHQLRIRIEKLTELPTLPDISNQLFKLSQTSSAGMNQLSAILELDPSITMQLIRYASSPFFGHHKVDSIQEAISYIGYDKSLNLALGFSAGRSFKVQSHGPIGLMNYWKHSVYAATLMQFTAEAMPEFEGKPKPGMSYLCGLLHNIGFLLLGHLFPLDFKAINRSVKENPEMKISQIEDNLIGTQHTEVGVWLMRTWQLPAELKTTVFEHHNSYYCGDNSEYANLAYIVNALLKSQNIGDSDTDVLPEKLMQKLHIDKEMLEEQLVKLVARKDELDTIIHSLSS